MRKTALLVLTGFAAGLGIAFWLQSSSEHSVGSDLASGTASAVHSSVNAGLAPARLEDGLASRVSQNAGGELDPPFIDRSRRDCAATRQEQRLAVDLIVAGFAPDRAEWKCSKLTGAARGPAARRRDLLL